MNSFRKYLLHFVLVVSSLQRCLCCSRDGIVEGNETIHLVEIRCPYFLKDSLLIDHENLVSFVPYVVYENGRLSLKRGDQYFTQVMLMLYILVLEHTFFFCLFQKTKYNCKCWPGWPLLGQLGIKVWLLSNNGKQVALWNKYNKSTHSLTREKLCLCFILITLTLNLWSLNCVQDGRKVYEAAFSWKLSLQSTGAEYWLRGCGALISLQNGQLGMAKTSWWGS